MRGFPEGILHGRNRVEDVYVSWCPELLLEGLPGGGGSTCRQYRVFSLKPPVCVEEEVSQETPSQE